LGLQGTTGGKAPNGWFGRGGVPGKNGNAITSYLVN